MLQPNGRLYESFSVFCPTERLDSLHLLESEDILIDWTQPLFLNFTHIDIMERLENFYSSIGTMEKVCGDVYVCSETPSDITLDELVSKSYLKHIYKINMNAYIYLGMGRLG